MFEIEEVLSKDDKEKVKEFLEKCKALLATNECDFSIRDKNNDFDKCYPLKHNDKIEILRSLSVNDCVKIAPNLNSNYHECDVYIFIKESNLIVYGEEDTIRLYIKMYLIEQVHFDKIIVISFHKAGILE